MKGNVESERAPVEERISTPIDEELAAFVRRNPFRRRQTRWLLLGMVGVGLGLGARWLSNQSSNGLVNEKLFSLQSSVGPTSQPQSPQPAAGFPEPKAAPEPLNEASLKASQALARSVESETEAPGQAPSAIERDGVLVIPPIWFGPPENRAISRSARRQGADAPVSESHAFGNVAANEDVARLNVSRFAAVVSDPGSARGLLIPPADGKKCSTGPCITAERGKLPAGGDISHAGLLIPPVSKPLIENRIGANAAAR